MHNLEAPLNSSLVHANLMIHGAVRSEAPGLNDQRIDEICKNESVHNAMSVEEKIKMARALAGDAQRELLKMRDPESNGKSVI